MAAIFSKGGNHETDHNPSAPRTGTTIGSTVKVEGTFSGEDNISIEGEVTGIITTTKDILVGKTAKIQAEITAANITVAGEIHGNMTISGTTTLTATSRIFGDIQTQVISVDTGAAIQGQCRVGAQQATEILAGEKNTPGKSSGTKK